jgi:hypothetical protein
MATLTWEEKVEKAKETAVKKAEKDGLDEQATQALIDEAVAKVMKAKKDAESKVAQTAQAKQDRGYIVKVKSNPAFCGIGAGGVQFANGEAHVTSERMAEWFREHNGYEVTKA